MYRLNSAAISGNLTYCEMRSKSVSRPRRSYSLSTVERSSHPLGVTNAGPSGVFSILRRFWGLTCR